MDPDGSDDGGGTRNLSGRYLCTDGWINGDIVDYFGLLAVALPLITVLGACASFRMQSPEQRAHADAIEGGDAVIGRRLNLGASVVLLVLFAVGISSVLSVVMDGDNTAVQVNMWTMMG